MSKMNSSQTLLWTTLIELKKIFDKVGMPFFLIGGTLLGFVRDGNIIPWDKDLDVAIFEEDEWLLDKAIEEAKKEEWRIEETNFPKKFGNRGRLVAFFKDKYGEGDFIKVDNKMRRRRLNHMDVWVIYRHKDIVWHNAYKFYICVYPRKYVENQSKITINGVTFNIPQVPEYLEYQYGEWKIPLDILDYSRILRNSFDCLDIEKTPVLIHKLMTTKTNYKIVLGSMFCNEEHSIPLYVQSLLALDYPKELIDVIWIENNSSDNSFQLLQTYEKQIKEKYDYHSFKLLKMDGNYRRLPKEELGKYRAGKIQQVGGEWSLVGNHMIGLQNFILKQATEEHDFVLYWFPDALCEPNTLKRFVRDMETYSDMGWIGGVLYRRFPLHRICKCENMWHCRNNPRRYGLDSPELKFYTWDDVPEYTYAKKLHNVGCDKAVFDMRGKYFPYLTRQIEEEEIFERQKNGNEIFKDVCVTAHIFLLRAEMIVKGVEVSKNKIFKFRWRSSPSEVGLGAERDLHAMGYEMYCDSYIFFKHISSNGKIYRDRLGPEELEIEKNMSEAEKIMVKASEEYTSFDKLPEFSTKEPSEPETPASPHP